MFQLNEQEIAEYLEKHIPYRINSMLAHDLIMHRKTLAEYREFEHTCYGDSLVVEPVFEISLIFGRTLLNFLGLTLDQKSGRLAVFAAKQTDLTIQSLFPNRARCRLDDDIVIAMHDGFCKIIRLANKSVAHLTTNVGTANASEFEDLPQIRLAICKLVLRLIPEIDRQKIWWYTQATPSDICC